MLRRIAAALGAAVVLGAFATPATAATVCYWRLYSNTETMRIGTQYGHYVKSTVDYQIGYTCDGMPLKRKVTTVHTVAYFGVSYAGTVHRLDDVRIEQSALVPVAILGTHPQCTGSCTINHYWYPNVTMNYSQDNRVHYQASNPLTGCIWVIYEHYFGMSHWTYGAYCGVG